MRDINEVRRALAAFETFRTWWDNEGDNGPETLVCAVLGWVLGDTRDFAKLVTDTVNSATKALGGPSAFDAAVAEIAAKIAAGGASGAKRGRGRGGRAGHKGT